MYICVFIYMEVRKKLQTFLSPTFMWVLGIKFRALELCGKHLNPLSHLISPFYLEKKYKTLMRI